MSCVRRLRTASARPVAALQEAQANSRKTQRSCNNRYRDTALVRGGEQRVAMDAERLAIGELAKNERSGGHPVETDALKSSRFEALTRASSRLLAAADLS